MALDLSTYRLSPLSSESRVGPQNQAFSLGSGDDLATCLTVGYLNALADSYVPIENRKIAQGDLVFLNYSAASVNSFWALTRIMREETNYSLVLGGSPMFWTTLPAATNKWISNAEVGITMYGRGVVRGTMTSASSSNSDLMVVFPAGYAPASFSKAISYIRAGQPIAADFGTSGNVAGTSLTADVGDVAHLNFEYELNGD